MCSKMLTQEAELPKPSTFQMSLDWLFRTLGVSHLIKVSLCAWDFGPCHLGSHYVTLTSRGGRWGRRSWRLHVCVTGSSPPTEILGHQGVGEFPRLATSGACCHTLPRELSSVRTTGSMRWVQYTWTPPNASFSFADFTLYSFAVTNHNWV